MTSGARNPELHVREAEQADKLVVTGDNANAALRIFGLTSTVSGLTIVDLAAGASLVTSKLLERGANAFALDRMYADRSGLMDALNNRYISELRKSAQMMRPWEVNTIIKEAHQEIGQFFKSFDRHRERYIYGWLTQLPFENDFADWVVSSNGISALFGDFEVMSKSVNEAIRVAKPGGTVVMYPFLEEPESEKVHEALVQQLIASNVGKVLVERGVLYPSDNRLTIVKAA